MGGRNVSNFMLTINIDMICINSKEVDFDAESREERNLLYESKVTIIKINAVTVLNIFHSTRK